jgi:hypothetical protein
MTGSVQRIGIGIHSPHLSWALLSLPGARQTYLALKGYGSAMQELSLR